MSEIDIMFQEVMEDCEKYDPYQIQAEQDFENKESYKHELENNN